MEKFVGAPKSMQFEKIFLDPNNPRLGDPDPIGYEDSKKLLDPKRQPALEESLTKLYNVDLLVAAITGQGWMPIDNIVVWSPPDRSDACIVVEGNTRILALRRIRGPILERERKKLARLEAGAPKRYSEADVKQQRELVARLEQIVEDTKGLQVVPLAAKTVAELEHKLPRVLAVRHIQGAKPWGNFAEDVWLNRRYQHLFEEKHGETADPFWDPEIIQHVADEASLRTPAEAKRQLVATSAFGHFRAEYEDKLPEDEAFEPTDYYLFENIVKKPFLRDQFGLGADDRHLSEEGEEVLFEWVFKKARGRTAEKNQNVFYRHENVLVWDQMKRYDDTNNTNFASRFDVSDPENVPLFREVEAEWMAHKAQTKPQAVIDELLRRLRDLRVESLVNQGDFLRIQLKELRDQAAKYLKMIDAAAA
jgi:hypothetical protein